MGEAIYHTSQDLESKNKFSKYLVEDISALETLIENNSFENEQLCIGAEQEMCIVDSAFFPKKLSEELLTQLNDKRFTTELAAFNIELNLDPEELKGPCFQKIEKDLRKYLKTIHSKAAEYDAQIVLTGILPTISMEEIGMDYITPIPRYLALNKALMDLRGDDFNLKIRGCDEFAIKSDSVMYEACNTSFQMHLQIPADDFISSYNWAQAIAGPVMSICCNSPLLMGRELWRETRIALFQQSLDTRKSGHEIREQLPRVGFGYKWESGTIADIYKQDISRHPIILTKPISEGSCATLQRGEIPNLDALRLFNGTVYRWNRPCYGVNNGRPHLRIENRYIPAGPSVEDQMANFAFWVGLMKGRPLMFDDMPQVMNFKTAKSNFIQAARNGKDSLFFWNGKTTSAKKLIINELLPLAYNGLRECNVDKNDIERYLSIIEKRSSGRTADQWQIRTYRKLRRNNGPTESLRLLTSSLYENQNSGQPVHKWPNIDLKKIPKGEDRKVKDLMSTNLFVINYNDTVEMAVTIMKWNNVHHLPVENEEGILVGLITASHLENLSKDHPLTGKLVKEVMIKDLISASPNLEIEQAKALMNKHKIGSLLVWRNNTLIGILSKKDFD